MKNYENKVTGLERIRRKTIAVMTEYLIYLHREAEQVKEAIQKMDRS